MRAEGNVGVDISPMAEFGDDGRTGDDDATDGLVLALAFDFCRWASWWYERLAL